MTKLNYDKTNTANINHVSILLTSTSFSSPFFFVSSLASASRLRKIGFSNFLLNSDMLPMQLKTCVK